MTQRGLYPRYIEPDHSPRYGGAYWYGLGECHRLRTNCRSLGADPAVSRLESGSEWWAPGPEICQPYSTLTAPMRRRHRR